jgi:hypothetical protein
MKKYKSPQLVTYGNVETLTQANGNGSANDFYIFTGVVNIQVPGSSGRPAASGSSDLHLHTTQMP